MPKRIPFIDCDLSSGPENVCTNDALPLGCILSTAFLLKAALRLAEPDWLNFYLIKKN